MKMSQQRNQIGVGVGLDHIYNRSEFTVIGLTGKTGSGCTEVANQLAEGFGNGSNFENPKEIFQLFGKKPIDNSFRKHRIVYQYAEENFKPFSIIEYKDIVTFFLLKSDFKELVHFVREGEAKWGFSNVSNELSQIEAEFNTISQKLELTKFDDQKLADLFFEKDFKDFSNSLHRILGNQYGGECAIFYHKLLQLICDNLRRSGNPYDIKTLNPNDVFTIVELINSVLKGLSHQQGRTQIVINSLKNPFELLFFKQRYSGFYAFAINREDDDLEGEIRGKFTMHDSKFVDEVLKEEYQGGKGSEFFKQSVEKCFQLADIHINFLSKIDARIQNSQLFDFKIDKISGEYELDEGSEDVGAQKRINTDNLKISPYFSWHDQLIKYVSLIDMPGIVNPSPEERCMQLAYTSMHNSGCISRHVGAAITDQEFSIKAIGWNSTPAGQVPCSLRNAEDLIYNKSDHDRKAFTKFETDNTDFKEALKENFEQNIIDNRKLLKGRNPCFCFKSLKNSISEGKNQVHTRSLHAEENAFLQLTKYGGTGIRNGILFSTASPCELCSKKAYQLGIRLIYYIDPYPGISMSHILDTGDSPIMVRLFTGAIGSAYHRIYQPMMSYKDELALLLGQNIKDKTRKLEDDLSAERDRNKELTARIEELEKKIK